MHALISQAQAFLPRQLALFPVNPTEADTPTAVLLENGNSCLFLKALNAYL